MNELTTIFQSLEEEIRLRILALLMEAGELCVCDLMAVLQLPQSTVSRHLSHMKNAGWLQDRREGLWSYYSVVRQLGPLQQSLLPTLSFFLMRQDTVKLDLESLKARLREKSCPTAPPEH